MIPPGKIGKRTAIFEGKIFSKQTIDLDTKDYNYLLITCAMYDYEPKNTSGTSTTILLDLTTKGEKVNNYSCSSLTAYGVLLDVADEIGGMGVGVSVNAEKTTFKAVFSYKNDFITSTNKLYYISKIVGIK